MNPEEQHHQISIDELNDNFLQENFEQVGNYEGPLEEITNIEDSPEFIIDKLNAEIKDQQSKISQDGFRIANLENENNELRKALHEQEEYFQKTVFNMVCHVYGEDR